jgi:hypothetical protein
MASARSGLLNEEDPVELVFADMLLSIVRGGGVTDRDFEVVGFLFGACLHGRQCRSARYCRGLGALRNRSLHSLRQFRR